MYCYVCLQGSLEAEQEKEVGFDFEDLLKNHENATRVTEGEEWKLGQRFDADSMSCFPLFYKSLF